MPTLIDNALVGETSTPRQTSNELPCPILVLGVGNLLMGDEGVGVHVLRHLEHEPAIPGVRLLDGGTGGINLLLEFDGVRNVVLIDATRDGKPAGTITFQQPRNSDELPRGLGAHDFGLKDLFAVSALLGDAPTIHLFTISVEEIRPMSMELSPAVADAVPELVQTVVDFTRKSIAS